MEADQECNRIPSLVLDIWRCAGFVHMSAGGLGFCCCHRRRIQRETERKEEAPLIEEEVFSSVFPFVDGGSVRRERVNFKVI